jgi:hypothetical protein
LQHETRILRKGLRDESNNNNAFQEYQVTTEIKEDITNINPCQTQCVDDLMSISSNPFVLKCIGYHYIWDKTVPVADQICTFYYGVSEFSRRLGLAPNDMQVSIAPEFGTLFTWPHEKDETRVEEPDPSKNIDTKVTFSCARGGK